MFHLAKLMRAEKVRGRTECDVVASCELIADGTAVSYIPNLYCCWAEDSSLPSLHSMKHHLYRSDKSSRGLRQAGGHVKEGRHRPKYCVFSSCLKTWPSRQAANSQGLANAASDVCCLWQDNKLILTWCYPCTAERHHSSYSVWLVLLHGFPSEEHVASRASH